LANAAAAVHYPLATITPDGQAFVREATEALNQASSACLVSPAEAAEVTSVLRGVRGATADIASGEPRASAPAADPWQETLLAAGLSLGIYRHLRSTTEARRCYGGDRSA
jgi:hypothetical protein